jgi:hypothetical protein
MALVTANGVTVIEGTIVRPLVGVWIADLKIDQAGGSGFGPGTQVTIASEGGYSIVGVVDPNRTGDFLDSMHVRILGGGGGMAKTASTRSYSQGTFARDVINGFMTDAGEELSSTADAGMLGTSLNGWSVMGKTINWNLRALLRIVAPSMNWRILADGTLWIGTEMWPSASGTFDAIDQDPADGSYVLGVEAPFVVPGTNIDGVGHINRCVDVITAGRLRTHVFVDLPSEGVRGANAAVARMVTQALAGVDYYASYVCQVVAQSADLTTVDVSPVGARNQQLLGGLQHVPLRGVTGIQPQIVAGATVLLGWDGGNPSAPYALGGLGGDSVTSMVIAGGVNHAARVGDSTSGHVHALGSATAGPYPVMGSTVTATDTIAENGGRVKIG